MSAIFAIRPIVAAANRGRTLYILTNVITLSIVTTGIPARTRLKRPAYSHSPDPTRRAHSPAAARPATGAPGWGAVGLSARPSVYRSSRRPPCYEHRHDDVLLDKIPQLAGILTNANQNLQQQIYDAVSLELLCNRGGQPRA